VVERLKTEYNVDVEWRPYYLRPDTPPEGMELPDYILRARANGADERLRAWQNYTAWIHFPERILQHTPGARSDRVRATNTAKPTNSITWSFARSMAEGLDISKWDVLRSAAEEAGLDAEDMQNVVESGKYTAEVAGAGAVGAAHRCDRRADVRDQRSLCHRRRTAV
jgi:predicted DsbA family dithiol-disulfide isomerase